MPFQTVNQNILKERTLYLCWSVRATCFNNVTDKDTRLMLSINNKIECLVKECLSYHGVIYSMRKVHLDASIIHNKMIMQTYAIK